MKRKIIVAISVVLLLSVLSICLFACNSSNNTMDYVKKLYKKGYDVDTKCVFLHDEEGYITRIEGWSIRATNKELRNQGSDGWGEHSWSLYGGRVFIEIYTNEDDAKQRYDEFDPTGWYGEVTLILKANAVIYGDTECVKDAK